MNPQNVNTAASESTGRWGKAGYVRSVGAVSHGGRCRHQPEKENTMHLHLTESSAVLGMNATCEAERAYWRSRENAAVSAAVEIDVTAFHEAAGLMYPMNWRHDTAQDTETFMLAEMYCGNVTEIYVRCGRRYFRMRDYCNTNHADIVRKVKEVFSPKTDSQK